MPRIRSTPEDFEVEEMPLYELSGDGSYLYLEIEKRLCNTHDVAQSLARALDVKRRDVGYAGRKDRIAVTRQWFSIPRDRAARLAHWDHPGARVLRTQAHNERLRVGQLEGNCFRLLVRDVDEETAQKAQNRLREMARRGMPNRFGKQRFGRDGKNVERGLRVLRSERIRGNRQNAWLMVSAVQSEVFNRVLATRDASFDELLPGDVAYVHGTAETFLVGEVPDRDRVASFELSPTGPIFGLKMLWPRGETAEHERRVMAELDLGDPRRLVLPRGLKLFGDRRPLRVAPKKVDCAWQDGLMGLTFELPAGSYATVLLEELLPAGFEEGPAELSGRKESPDKMPGS